MGEMKMIKKWIKITEGEGRITGDGECWCIKLDLGEKSKQLKELQKIMGDMNKSKKERFKAFQEFQKIKPWESELTPIDFEPEEYQEYAEDFRVNMKSPEWDDDWWKRSTPKIRFKITFEIEVIE